MNDLRRGVQYGLSTNKRNMLVKSEILATLLARLDRRLEPLRREIQEGKQGMFVDLDLLTLLLREPEIDE